MKIATLSPEICARNSVSWSVKGKAAVRSWRSTLPLQSPADPPDRTYTVRSLLYFWHHKPVGPLPSALAADREIDRGNRTDSGAGRKPQRGNRTTARPGTGKTEFVRDSMVFLLYLAFHAFFFFVCVCAVLSTFKGWHKKKKKKKMWL